MKKFVAVMLFMSVLFSLFAAGGQAASAAIVPKLYLNDKQLVSTVSPQLLQNKYTVVPIRLVSESIGLRVNWSQADKTVTILNGDDTIILKINDSIALVNGGKVQMDTPAVMQKDTTLVPLRFVGENLGLDVSWDNTSKSVYLNEKTPPPDETEEPDESPDPGDSDPAAGSLTSIAYDGAGGITVTYDGSVAPSKPVLLDNPKRIVFDLPNAGYADSFEPAFADDSKMGEIAVTGHPTLSKIRYSLYSLEPSTVRIVLDLTGSSSYELKEGDGQLTIQVAQSTDSDPTPTTPPATGDKVYTVIIDAGHGGKDPGAQSITSRWEKETNLKIAQKVKALLDKEKNINAVMTRSDDTFIELTDRVKIAEQNKADAFISIHANSAAASSASGSETYYTRANSKTLAQTVHKYLVKGTGLKDRGIKTANYLVIKNTTMPAILMETGFLTSPTDSAVLFNDTKQQAIAAQIVLGIKEYFKLS